MEEDKLVCLVTDQGRGMQGAGAERLDKLSAAREEGKRLGLDVIVNILGNLNGTASVRSEPDSGTVIRVVIPLEDKA